MLGNKGNPSEFQQAIEDETVIPILIESIGIEEEEVLEINIDESDNFDSFEVNLSITPSTIEEESFEVNLSITPSTIEEEQDKDTPRENKESNRNCQTDLDMLARICSDINIPSFTIRPAETSENVSKEKTGDKKDHINEVTKEICNAIKKYDQEKMKDDKSTGNLKKITIVNPSLGIMPCQMILTLSQFGEIKSAVTKEKKDYTLIMDLHTEIPNHILMGELSTKTKITYDTQQEECILCFENYHHPKTCEPINWETRKKYLEQKVHDTDWEDTKKINAIVNSIHSQKIREKPIKNVFGRSKDLEDQDLEDENIETTPSEQEVFLRRHDPFNKPFLSTSRLLEYKDIIGEIVYDSLTTISYEPEIEENSTTVESDIIFKKGEHINLKLHDWNLIKEFRLNHKENEEKQSFKGLINHLNKEPEITSTKVARLLKTLITNNLKKLKDELGEVHQDLIGTCFFLKLVRKMYEIFLFLKKMPLYKAFHAFIIIHLETIPLISKWIEDYFFEAHKVKEKNQMKKLPTTDIYHTFCFQIKRIKINIDLTKFNRQNPFPLLKSQLKPQRKIIRNVPTPKTQEPTVEIEKLNLPKDIMEFNIKEVEDVMEATHHVINEEIKMENEPLTMVECSYKVEDEPLEEEKEEIIDLTEEQPQINEMNKLKETIEKLKTEKQVLQKTLKEKEKEDEKLKEFKKQEILAWEKNNRAQIEELTNAISPSNIKEIEEEMTEKELSETKHITLKQGSFLQVLESNIKTLSPIMETMMGGKRITKALLPKETLLELQVKSQDDSGNITSLSQQWSHSAPELILISRYNQYPLHNKELREIIRDVHNLLGRFGGYNAKLLPQELLALRLSIPLTEYMRIIGFFDKHIKEVEEKNRKNLFIQLDDVIPERTDSTGNERCTRKITYIDSSCESEEKLEKQNPPIKLKIKKSTESISGISHITRNALLMQNALRKPQYSSFLHQEHTSEKDYRGRSYRREEEDKSIQHKKRSLSNPEKSDKQEGARKIQEEEDKRSHRQSKRRNEQVSECQRFIDKFFHRWQQIPIYKIATCTFVIIMVNLILHVLYLSTEKNLSTIAMDPRSAEEFIQKTILSSQGKLFELHSIKDFTTAFCPKRYNIMLRIFGTNIQEIFSIIEENENKIEYQMTLYKNIYIKIEPQKFGFVQEKLNWGECHDKCKAKKLRMSTLEEVIGTKLSEAFIPITNIKFKQIYGAISQWSNNDIVATGYKTKKGFKKGIRNYLRINNISINKTTEVKIEKSIPSCGILSIENSDNKFHFVPCETKSTCVCISPKQFHHDKRTKLHSQTMQYFMENLKMKLKHIRDIKFTELSKLVDILKNILEGHSHLEQDPTNLNKIWKPEDVMGNRHKRDIDDTLLSIVGLAKLDRVKNLERKEKIVHEETLINTKKLLFDRNSFIEFGKHARIMFNQTATMFSKLLSIEEISQLKVLVIQIAIMVNNEIMRINLDLNIAKIELKEIIDLVESKNLQRYLDEEDQKYIIIKEFIQIRTIEKIDTDNTKSFDIHFNTPRFSTENKVLIKLYNFPVYILENYTLAVKECFVISNQHLNETTGISSDELKQLKINGNNFYRVKEVEKINQSGLPNCCKQILDKSLNVIQTCTSSLVMKQKENFLRKVDDNLIYFTLNSSTLIEECPTEKKELEFRQGMHKIKLEHNCKITFKNVTYYNHFHKRTSQKVRIANHIFDERPLDLKGIPIKINNTEFEQMKNTRSHSNSISQWLRHNFILTKSQKMEALKEEYKNIYKQIKTELKSSGMNPMDWLMTAGIIIICAFLSCCILAICNTFIIPLFSGIKSIQESWQKDKTRNINMLYSGETRNSFYEGKKRKNKRHKKKKVSINSFTELDFKDYDSNSEVSYIKAPDLTYEFMNLPRRHLIDNGVMGTSTSSFRKNEYNAVIININSVNDYLNIMLTLQCNEHKNNHTCSSYTLLNFCSCKNLQCVHDKPLQVDNNEILYYIQLYRSKIFETSTGKVEELKRKLMNRDSKQITNQHSFTDAEGGKPDEEKKNLKTPQKQEETAVTENIQKEEAEVENDKENAEPFSTLKHLGDKEK